MATDQKTIRAERMSLTASREEKDDAELVAAVAGTTVSDLLRERALPSIREDAARIRASLGGADAA